MAIAYCGPPPAPVELAASFNLDPVLLVAMAVAAVLMRRRPMALAGMAVLLVAFVSPLCALTSSLFAARSVHHLLLVAIAAPLFALSIQSWRAGASWLWLLSCGAVLTLWHVPQVYDLALSNVAVFWVLQLSLLGTSVGLWRSVFEPGKTVVMRGLTVVLAFAQMGLIGAILTFASEPLYAAHAVSPLEWGLTPLDDQRLGGLIMWVAAVIPYAAIAAIMLRQEWAWLGQSRTARP